MPSLPLHPQLWPHIDAVEGATLDAKLVALLEAYLTAHLRACEREIGNYELKYRATFDEFATDWEQGRIPGKREHAVERDYMEWEGLVAEKQKWLERLRKLPRQESLEPVPA